MIVKRAVAKQGSVAGVLLVLDFFLGGILPGWAWEKLLKLLVLRRPSRSACWLPGLWALHWQFLQPK